MVPLLTVTGRLKRTAAERKAGYRTVGVWIANGVAIGTVLWSVGIALLIGLLGDRWWIATIALFAPRWLLALPILLAVAGWLWLNKYVKCATFAAVLVVMWGVLGVSIPVSGWFARPDPTYRLLTCNVAGWIGGTERLEKLIRDSRADIVMLQEYSDQTDFALPDNWSTYRDGELLIASRYPLENRSIVTRRLPGRWPRAVGLYAEAVTPNRTIRLYTVHLLSPHYGLSGIVDSSTIIAPSRRAVLIDEMRKRGSESARVAAAIDRRSGAVVVAGDLNMPVESFFFRRHWRGFRNAFSRVGFGIGNTCFVEKRGMRFAARIDHVLTRGEWHAVRCWVGPDVGSDHRPLLADLYWE